jgi:ankyrin repeat protein
MTAGALVPNALAAQAATPAAPAPAPAAQAAAPERPPRLDPDLVRDFVIAGHANLDRTRELLDQHPALINATWDWGGGDWETALGGASHMGNREIAAFLLSRGARMDVFCAATTGKIEIVRGFLADDPRVIDLKGPHGIPLIRHAQAGQQDQVVELLVAHGAKA